ncbi:hypothetical protein KI387_006829, partial [Taxus chinensis]
PSACIMPEECRYTFHDSEIQDGRRCDENDNTNDSTYLDLFDSVPKFEKVEIRVGRGKHTFILLGYAEINEFFDFNVALCDHENYIMREHEKEGTEEDDDGKIQIHLAMNH